VRYRIIEDIIILYRVGAHILILVLLLNGCTGQQRTKEQLVTEGIKLAQGKDPRGAIILFKNALDKDQNYFDARFQLAKAYSAIGKLDAAEKELQKVRRQNPSSRDVQIEIARIMAYTDRPDEALKNISAYLGDDSADCEALQIAGWAHVMKEDNQGAVTLLKKSVAICGGRIEPVLTLATVYVIMGNMQEAETQLAPVMAKEPANKKALYLLAEIQTHRKDRPAALKTLDRIIQENHDDIEARYRKGLLYVESGDYDNALALSEAMMKQFPNRAEGHRLQGFVLFYKQQYRDAIALLQKSLLMQPNVGAYYILGLSHYYQNEAELAMNQFRKALDIKPSFTRARVHLALLLLNKQRVDDAIQEAKGALAQDEDNAFAHNVLGSAYLAKGNYAEGITELNKALEIDPSLADVHVKKGLVAMKRGKGQEAESELAAAVRLKPEAQDARRVLALYYINHSEPVKAIEVLKKGIQGGRFDAVTYYLMAESCLQQNNISEAVANYIKAKEAEPKYDLAYLKLASIYFMQEKHEEGIKELRSLVEHSPDNVQALLLLASLAEANGDESEALKTFLRAADTRKTEGIIAAAQYLQRTKEPEKALKVLNEGIRQSPTDINLLEAKGRALLSGKKFKDALAVFETIERSDPRVGFGSIVNTYLAMGEQAKALEKIRTEIKNNPTNLGLRAELSRIYLQMGNKTEAVESAQEIIRNNPDSAVGYLVLALIYQSNNDIDKSIEVLGSASKIKDAKLAFMLGNLYALRKNYTAALEQYRKAENVKGGADQILFQKGTVLHAMGKKKEAVEEYQKALRLSPNHVMALNNLAYIYGEENRNLSRALMYATRAFMLAPQNDLIRDTLGYVLLKNGRTVQGMNMLKKASESSPNNPNILYHLALAYKERGELVKTMETLQKALALGAFSEASDAKGLLEKIKKNGKS
jgi:putative PEP-CTERM system TPR-repeat lipoprotein